MDPFLKMILQIWLVGAEIIGIAMLATTVLFLLIMGIAYLIK